MTRFKKVNYYAGDNDIPKHVDELMWLDVLKITIEQVTPEEREALGDEMSFWQWKLVVEFDGEAA